LFATDIRQHAAVDLDARTEHLAALLDHLLALGRIVNDVAILVGQIVLAQDGAHALAPAAAWFEVSDNLRFVHVPHSWPRNGARQGWERNLLTDFEFRVCGGASVFASRLSQERPSFWRSGGPCSLTELATAAPHLTRHATRNTLLSWRAS